ncbi:hypothetical protein DOTSEDRAFT_68019 [Dothistroma septosporum NZE10]|uniref:1-alkyl-2-acetylglycerophosphocholine esterase n=1 Tax=Dothistroma septosporum (strain NZE10 / CBS 128990) TaxID=675120 RepID=N1Q3W9_DOTSN|nr:hypothetical protein DOTSEDRAFT_68019 [Dothistroma septosporum NZE10]
MKLPSGHPKLGSEKTSQVPNAKKPKARPPRGWRDTVLLPARALPTYTGPYPVGTMEIEVPASDPRVFSDISRNKRHMLQLETVLMTVYYPASILDPYDKNAAEQGSKPSRELWLGRPRLGTAAGYGKFSGTGGLAIPVFLPTMFTKLPAFRNAAVAKYWAPEVNTRTRGKRVKTESGETPEGAENEPVFPFILFSHGLGGTRTMYSSVCGEFASYGFVVCAVEHRDGSGPRTYINYAKKGEGTATDIERRGHVDHRDEERRQGFSVVEYLFPKDNPLDTSPQNDKGVDTELRKAQIDLRMAELEEAYSIMKEIVGGNGKMIADRNLRKAGYKGASRHGLEGIDWSRWEGRLRLDHVTICGHSFGAATAVEILRHNDRFNYVSQGIIYDIWGAGTRPVEDDKHRIDAPLIAINSEAFTYWPSNFELVESLVKEAEAEPRPCPAWLMTLRGTVHVSQSDFSLLYPNVCSIFLKMMANPRRALDLNINASLEFLSHVLPKELAQVNRAYKNEELLETELSPLERIPSYAMHKPKKDKYLAARLQIRHEWFYRISPKLFRSFKRWRMEQKGHSPQRNDEIWLHSKPQEQVLADFLRNVPGRDPDRQDNFDVHGAVTDEGTDEVKPVQIKDSDGGPTLG